MLFFTPEFIFVYLPVVLGGFFLLERWSRQGAMAWLLAASLVFYAYWDSRNLMVLLPSAAFNFIVGCKLIQLSSCGRRLASGWLLALGISGNLAALLLFKYQALLWNSVASFLDLGGVSTQVDLPLGISFFTFTQIAFLIDARDGAVRDADPIRYGLFVTYFPHLIAGPIMHHADVMPQFSQRGAGSVRINDVAIGLAVFVVGLFKKVGIADFIGTNVSAVFNAAESGAPLTTTDCWFAALSYSMQIYFDFSGYS